MGFESADRVQDEEGRQYHIGLAPGEVAPWVILVGDPARVEVAARELEDPAPRRRNREFVSTTGRYRGVEVTVLGTGIGCDNTEIAVTELLACRRDLTLLRVGSCGALQPDIALGDLVVSTGSVRLESTSLGFVEEGFPAVAHHEAVLALISAAEAAGAPYHVGLTASASGFYGWQGRRGQLLEPRFPDLPERLGRAGVLNFEMEASTLFTLATLASARAGAVCAVYASRPSDRFIAAAAKEEAERRAVRCGLDAVLFLAAMSRDRRPFSLDPAIIEPSVGA